jgi:hypothetical protein
VSVADVEEEDHRGKDSRFSRASLLQGDVSADDAFEAAMLGAEQQRAIVVECLGHTLEESVANVDGNAATERGAMSLPLV